MKKVLLMLVLGACTTAPPHPPSTCPAWSAKDAQDICLPRTWSAPETVAVDALGEHTATLAPDGSVNLVWTQQESAGWALKLRRGNGVTEVVSEAQFAQPLAPSVAVTSDNRLFVAWQRSVGEVGAVFAWDGVQAEQFSTSETAYQPVLQAGPDGEMLLVWNQWYAENYGVRVARKVSSNVGWERPLDILSPPIFFSNAPLAAIGPDGAAIITWYQSTGGPLMVYVSERSAASQPFSHASVDTYISPEGAAVDSHFYANPRPAISRQGEAAVVWTQDDADGVPRARVATRKAGGDWNRPTSLEDALSEKGHTARCAQASFTADGTLWAAWYENTNDVMQLRAARRPPDGAWQFTDLGSGVTPSLAAGEHGVVLAWARQVDEGSWEIVVSRGWDGEAGWGAPERISSAQDQEMVLPVTVMREDGDSAAVAWLQGRLNHQDLMMVELR